MGGDTQVAGATPIQSVGARIMGTLGGVAEFERLSALASEEASASVSVTSASVSVTSASVSVTPDTAAATPSTSVDAIDETSASAALPAGSVGTDAICHKIRAVPPCVTGVTLIARVAWTSVLARTIELASACTLEHAFSQARALEHAIFEDARLGRVVAANLFTMPSERKQSEALQYHTNCQRVCVALTENGARLLHACPDITALLHMDTAHLSVGCESEAWRARKAEEQAYVKRVLEDGRKTTVTEGFIRCTQCRSFNVDTDTQQTRSMDEPSDLVWKCNDCGKFGRRRG